MHVKHGAPPRGRHCTPRSLILGLATGACACFLFVVLWVTPQYTPWATPGSKAHNVTLEAAQPLKAPQQQPASGVHLGSDPGRAGVPAYDLFRQSEPDDLTWPGGLFVLRTNRTPPVAAAPEAYADKALKCWDYAVKTEQPLTELYEQRNDTAQWLSGGVQRAFFRWEGNITREDFDAVPEGHPSVRYQIIDGHLYRRGKPPNWLVDVAEDLALVAIHLWKLPDMDFILRLNDRCHPGLAALNWNICRDSPRAGFTFPSYTAWMWALGPQQLQVYHECLASRYPLKSRRPAVLWRGSTTDPKKGPFSIKDVTQVARMVIHKRFARDPVVDAKVTKIIGGDDCVKQYLEPLGSEVALEDYNTAAIIMDVDGNGWSDRMSRLVHFSNSPVLKQASNNTAFYEHLLAPGHNIEHYHNDLSNLKDRAHELIAEWKASPARLVRQAEQRQAMALVMLNQIAVAEAMAFSMLEYSKRITWNTTRDPTYEHVPFSQVCIYDRNKLPKAFCEKISARPPRP